MCCWQVRSSQTARASVIEQLKRDLKITHKEKPDTYVGIRIEQDKDGMRISQEAYVNEILKRYGMEESKGMRTPWVQRPVKRQDKDKPLEPRVMQEIIGSLTYLAGATRPDISAAVHALEAYQSEPCEEHFKAAKRILRYLNSTKSYGIKYLRDGTGIIEGYCDADHAGDVDTRRSTSGTSSR